MQQKYVLVNFVSFSSKNCLLYLHYNFQRYVFSTALQINRLHFTEKTLRSGSVFCDGSRRIETGSGGFRISARAKLSRKRAKLRRKLRERDIEIARGPLPHLDTFVKTLEQRDRRASKVFIHIISSPNSFAHYT